MTNQTASSVDIALEVFLPSLDFVDVVRCSEINKAWKDTSQSDIVWDTLCQTMWSDKVYVPADIRSLRKLHPRQAFREALKDSKRNWIKVEELLEFRWWHRMKESAGGHFTDNDAWWNGDSKSQRSFRFFRDGTLKWIDAAGQIDEADDGSGTWRFVQRCCGKTKGVWGEASLDESPPDILGGMDGDTSSHEPAFGTFIRGRPRTTTRETPTKVIFRHPKTWGFILDSCWAVQTSWPMPARGEDPSLEDDALVMNVGNMSQEASRFNAGVPIDPTDPEPGHLGPHDGFDADGAEMSQMVRVSLSGRVIELPFFMLQSLLRGERNLEEEELGGD